MLQLRKPTIHKHDTSDAKQLNTHGANETSTMTINTTKSNILYISNRVTTYVHKSPYHRLGVSVAQLVRAATSYAGGFDLADWR